MEIKPKITAVATKSEHKGCARCRRHHYSVGLTLLYPDLCCICAYDIHHLLVINAHLFKKEGELK